MARDGSRPKTTRARASPRRRRSPTRWRWPTWVIDTNGPLDETRRQVGARVGGDRDGERHRRRRQRQRHKSDADVSLVTGFPAFTARRLVRAAAGDRPPTSSVYLLVARQVPQRRRGVPGARCRPTSRSARARRSRATSATWTSASAGGEYKALAAELTAIHHTAAVYYLGAKRELVERVNVDGTRTILELAADCAQAAPLHPLVDGAGVGRALGRHPRGGARLRAALPQHLRGDQVPRRAAGARRRAPAADHHLAARHHRRRLARPARSTSSTAPTTSWC